MGGSVAGGFSKAAGTYGKAGGGTNAGASRSGPYGNEPGDPFAQKAADQKTQRLGLNVTQRLKK